MNIMLIIHCTVILYPIVCTVKPTYIMGIEFPRSECPYTHDGNRIYVMGFIYTDDRNRGYTMGSSIYP